MATAAPVNAWARLIYSPVNYWVSMIADAVAAIVLLIVAAWHFDGVVAWAAVAAAAGFVGWSLTEYRLHRWLLHGPMTVARLGHLHHHASPKSLISTPVGVMLAGALVMWALLELVLPGGLAVWAVAGFYLGYNTYSILHHVQHHRPTLASDVGRLDFHDAHHRRHVVNYGIITTFWDRVFGTYEPNEVTARVMASRGRSGRTG